MPSFIHVIIYNAPLIKNKARNNSGFWFKDFTVIYLNIGKNEILKYYVRYTEHPQNDISMEKLPGAIYIWSFPRHDKTPFGECFYHMYVRNGFVFGWMEVYHEN